MKDEIRRSLAEATPGPWEIADTTDGYVLLDADGRELAFCESIGGEDDARLIANAPEWLKWQNDRIEQLEKALEEIASYDKGLFENDYFEMRAIARKAIGKDDWTMEKVKLPKEVADAIKSLSMKWGRKAFLQADYITRSGHKEAVVINEYFKPFESSDSKGFDELVSALYIGYEIEPEPITVTITPEQQSEIKEYLGSLDPAKASDELKIKGFYAALDLADIKIPGIND